MADEVICTALRKFKLPNVDPALFFLLQINLETGGKKNFFFLCLEHIYINIPDARTFTQC